MAAHTLRMYCNNRQKPPNHITIGWNSDVAESVSANECTVYDFNDQGTLSECRTTRLPLVYMMILSCKDREREQTSFIM